MSDDARTKPPWERWLVNTHTVGVTAIARQSASDALTEIDRLRARVAELETAGDRVVDLVDGESDLPGVVRDVVDDLRCAVRAASSASDARGER